MEVRLILDGNEKNGVRENKLKTFYWNFTKNEKKYRPAYMLVYYSIINYLIWRSDIFFKVFVASIIKTTV